MSGRQAGFDMTTQEGLDAFMAVYNSRILNDLLPHDRAQVSPSAGT